MYRRRFFYVMIEREKFYGCKTSEDAEAKIVEWWMDDVHFCVYTAYFGDCEKSFNCFRNWRNYVEADIALRLYLKVGDEWEGVVYRHINKDNVDDTEDALKCISGLLGRDANNEDMF